MRTTLNLDDGLLRRAKERAAREGTTLTRLLEIALRRYLAPAPRNANRFKLVLKTRKAGPLPGVDIADRDSLYERMEERQ